MDCEDIFLFILFYYTILITQTLTIELLEYDGFWFAVMFKAESSGSKFAVEVLVGAGSGGH